MDTGQTSSLGEEEGEGQGSFVSFSEEKGTKDHTASFSFASSAPPIPLFPPTPPPPSLFPSGSRSILHLLLRGKRGGGACGAPLLCAAVVVAPLRPDVCMVALPNRLIVVFSISSAPPRALSVASAIPMRCSRNCRFSCLLFEEINCCIIYGILQ